MSDNLEIDSVIIEFGGRRILQDVYLKCETGMVTGLLGHNGSGKTTLMRLLAGILTKGEYNVRINGSYISGFNDRKGNIVFLPQYHFIPRNFTVESVFRDYGLDMEDFFGDFPGTEAIRTQRIGNLSGGEKRLVEIYGVLRTDAKFVLLDEPFSYIMPKHVNTICRIIKEESSRKGMIITDHLYRYVTGICDEIYLVTGGRCFKTRGYDDLLRYGYVSGRK